MSNEVTFSIDCAGLSPVSVSFVDPRTEPGDSRPMGIIVFQEELGLRIGSCQINTAMAGVAPVALMMGTTLSFGLYRKKATVGEVTLRTSSDKLLLGISVPELGIDGSCELSSEARLRLTQLLRGEMEVA